MTTEKLGEYGAPRKDDGAVPVSAADSLLLPLRLYKTVTQKQAVGSRDLPWAKICEYLARRKTCPEKQDARLFNFTHLRDGASRGNASVETLHAVVLDHDKGPPFKEIASGIRQLDYFAY